MKKATVLMLLIFILFLFSGCITQSEEYSESSSIEVEELNDDIYWLEKELKDYENDYDELYTENEELRQELGYYEEMAIYYEEMTDTLGLVSYDQAYYPEYYDYYLCSNKIYHQDWLCKSFNHNNLINTIGWLTVEQSEELTACPHCSPNKEPVLISSTEKLIHTIPSSTKCMKLGTPDYKNVYTTYHVASKSAAISAGYQYCSSCNKN